MDDAFIQSRIDFYMESIVAYESVLLKLAADSTKSYTINTSQTVESVTRQDVDKIQALLKSLYGSLAFWEQKLENRSGNVVLMPYYKA